MIFKIKYILAIIMITSCYSLKAQELPLDKVIKAKMIAVADYQLEQKWSQAKQKNGKLVMSPITWEAGAFYPGILEVYRLTKDKKYLNAVKDIAKYNNYNRGPELRNADDQAILQSYLELYEIDNNPIYLKAAKSTLDSIMANPKNGALEYSWSDLLFMGPPIWTRYAKISKDNKYLDFQDKIYWEAVNNMLDKDYHLFYRDDRFKTMKGETGKPIFWSRGNGWVIAGLARMLDYMPKNYVNRPKYEKLMVDMATALKAQQQPDGFWKSDLLNPAKYPMGETSGTAFFCYGIAWGVNQGILDKKTFMPVVEKSWAALTSAVHNNGKLGWVQPGGDRPYLSTPEMSNWYSAGAFLMAGQQILKLN
jgi:unsaturated rhamnogalacturonyl hydrolase